MSNANFEKFVDQAEAALDATVDSGSDQELFIAGYLHGHFSLVISQCLLAGKCELAEMDSRMQISLAEAFASNELSEQDQQQVHALWQSLLASSHAA